MTKAKTARRTPGTARRKPVRATVPPPMDPVRQYAEDVIAGRIIAGELVRLACERHLRDLEKYADGKLYRWCWEAANRAIRFIECLQHYEGQFAGQDFLLQPWQKFIIGCVFGWLRLDNTRRFRRAYVSVGRGNGKTPLAAAILIYCSFVDFPQEPYADCRIGAVDGLQAQDIKDSVAAFVNQIPELRSLRTETKAAIVWNHNKSSIKQFSSNPKSVDGKRLHTVVLDEIHEWTDKNREVLDKIETAMGKRSNPLSWYITTAGTERSKIWKQKDGNAEQVLRGTFDDPNLFVYIARIDKGDDPFHEPNWYKANPNLGVSCNLTYLRDQANLARQDPIERSKFMRYHMNVEARSPDKLIDLEEWSACEGIAPPLKGLTTYGGLDLGWRNDLMALYWVTPIDVDADGKFMGQTLGSVLPSGRYRKYVVDGKCWIPEETKRALFGEPWLSWIKRGHLVVTPGDTTDPEAVQQEILRVREIRPLGSLAYDGSQDRTLGTTLLNTYGVPMFEFFQTCRKYNEPFRKLLAFLREGRLILTCPILRWAADNVIVKTDATGAVMPDKLKSIEKIDPIVAMLMGLAECIFSEAQPGAYAAHGLLRSE